ncbi:MAG: hypothetical protein ACKVG0_00485 [Alphaproteobacteria bacterium]
MKQAQTILIALPVLAATALVPVQAQTLYSTEDYRQDSELWPVPAYYRNNTVRQTRDMIEHERYGEEGSGVDLFELQSPYPYTNSEEHYQAWLTDADGGTAHTLETLPDWNGRWDGDEAWLGGDDIQVSTIVAALTPQYQEYFVQQVKAESEGRHFWPASFCLPRGFIESVVSNPKEFVLRPERVWVVGDTYTENLVRWIYTDEEHASEDFQFSQWHGESIGFWDGDALVIHTNQIRAWKGPVIEWSDELSTVERYERVGDAIVGEITFYDPIAFAMPIHVRFSHPPLPADHPSVRAIYNSCTDSNGPSANVFINDDGLLDQRGPGDAQYWDATDPRPWGAYYSRGE